MKGWQWLILFGLAALAIGAGIVGQSGIGPGGLVSALADAIATAEGFYVAGSIPQRKNNPGNITSGGVIQTFATVDDGWNALYAQISAMLNNTSQWYNSSMSLAQIGAIYANGDPNWAINVSRKLGVPSSTTLDQLNQEYAGG